MSGHKSSVYTVGRKEVINWINETLSVNYTKIEDMSNGAAFCQIFDYLHPKAVALNRVNFNASNPPEVMNNFKVLQESFDKVGIKQYLDIKACMGGKVMAALELGQWLYGYYNEHVDKTVEYDAVGRRKKCKLQEPIVEPSSRQSIGSSSDKDMQKPPTRVTSKPNLQTRQQKTPNPPNVQAPLSPKTQPIQIVQQSHLITYPQQICIKKKLQN